MAETSQTQMVSDLLGELNLDEAEQATITALVTSATEIVKRSVANLNPADPIAIAAVKTLATQMYYDRSLDTGMSKGLLMMLTHLQATPAGGDSSGS